MRLAAVLSLVLLASPAFAGAWTLGEGESKLFVTSSFTYGDHGWDEDGNLVTVPEYRKFELGTAIEYGVRPWLTLLGRGELKEERIDEPVTDTLVAPAPRSYGAVAGGARARLWSASHWVFSTELTAFSGGFDSLGTTEENNGPAVEARANVGFGEEVLARPVFADLSAGYRYRLDADESDEVKVDLTLGARVMPRWLLLAQTFSTFRTDGNGSHHKVAGSVVWNARDSLHVEVGAIATVAGRSAVQELGGRIGFWFEFGGPDPLRPQ